MLRLKSFSKSITGESDRSFNSPPADSTFETGGTFPIFLLDSSLKSPDLNVSEAICNDIKGFGMIQKTDTENKERKKEVSKRDLKKKIILIE